MKIEYYGARAAFENAINSQELPDEVTISMAKAVWVVTFKHWGTSKIWFNVREEKTPKVKTILELSRSKISWLHKKHEKKIRQEIGNVVRSAGGEVSDSYKLVEL